MTEKITHLPISYKELSEIILRNTYVVYMRDKEGVERPTIYGEDCASWEIENLLGKHGIQLRSGAFST